MNPQLDKLQPYPFERLRALFDGLTPPEALKPINLSIGEPKHPTPAVIRQAVCDHLDGLALYPATLGLPALRQTISQWIHRRYDALVDAQTQVLPVLGSREALFAFAQVVLDAGQPGTHVAFPNPFYQIYEGAALLGGAKPLYVNIDPETGLADFTRLSAEELNSVALLYVCSPNNPTGAVLSLDDWQTLFDLADAHNFVIAADECYSEIYLDEANPPIGALEAASRLGRSDYNNLVVFSSLSKRSNAPGLRSGFVAGDADWIARFLKYRTYHGSAMSVTLQHASIAAWNDEAHVQENRALYREKFTRFQDALKGALTLHIPPASFYFWAKVPHAPSMAHSDAHFAQRLYAQQHVTVLPGSFLGREHQGLNPGEGYVRMALVAPLDDCLEAAHRIRRMLIETL